MTQLTVHVQFVPLVSNSSIYAGVENTYITGMHIQGMQLQRDIFLQETRALICST